MDAYAGKSLDEIIASKVRAAAPRPAAAARPAKAGGVIRREGGARTRAAAAAPIVHRASGGGQHAPTTKLFIGAFSKPGACGREGARAGGRAAPARRAETASTLNTPQRTPLQRRTGRPT
jgi:hypothetical protein